MHTPTLLVGKGCNFPIYGLLCLMKLQGVTAMTGSETVSGASCSFYAGVQMAALVGPEI